MKIYINKEQNILMHKAVNRAQRALYKEGKYYSQNQLIKKAYEIIKKERCCSWTMIYKSLSSSIKV